MNADHKMKFLHELMKDNNHTYIDIIYKIIFQHENIRAVFSNATPVRGKSYFGAKA